MEKYDPQKAARVWQRVQSAQPQLIDGASLLTLIKEEWQDASTYLQLSRRVQGTSKTLLFSLYQEEQTHVACLKGIYTLLTGSHASVQPKPMGKETVTNVLRRCYGREMRALAWYESRSGDPEYGQVFSRLAVQEREHCKKILELLGSVPTTV